MSYHHQNLSGRRAGQPRLPLWRYGRAWWGPFAWGWNLFYPTSLLSVSVRRWSASIYLHWFGFYISLRDDDNDRGRWDISWHDGALWMEHPWIRQDGWDRSDPKWRRGPVRLPIVDWLIGRAVCETTEQAMDPVLIPMPEGCYQAAVTRGARTWRRRWYWPLRHRVDIWLDIPGGIPHAGKGENSWDCGDDALCGIGGATIEEAIGRAVSSVLSSRTRHGLDSRGTGRQSLATVVNANHFVDATNKPAGGGS